MVNLSGTETDTLPWGKEQRSTLGCLQKQTFRNALQRCLRLKLDKNETQDFWPLLLTRTETWDSVLHRSTFCDRWEKMKILEGRLRKFLFLPKLPCRISGKFLFRTRSLARILHYHQPLHSHGSDTSTLPLAISAVCCHIWPGFDASLWFGLTSLSRWSACL